jgi:hypothetical protein
MQKVGQKKLKMPSRSAAKKASVHSKDGEEEAAILQKVQVVGGKRLGKSHVFDELTFRLVNLRAQRVKRPSQNNRYKQKYAVVNVKHSASVMVWGCFSGIGGRGSLYFLPPKTTMKGDRYMEMLKEKLLFWMNYHKVSHFPQDSAPCHKSKKVMRSCISRTSL